MKKLICLGLIVAAVLFGSLGAYKNYRIHPLNEASHRAAVLSATRAECARNWEWYQGRALVLQASPNFVTVKVNYTEITVEFLRDILPQELGGRMDRSL